MQEGPTRPPRLPVAQGSATLGPSCEVPLGRPGPTGSRCAACATACAGAVSVCTCRPCVHVRGRARTRQVPRGEVGTRSPQPAALSTAPGSPQPAPALAGALSPGDPAPPGPLLLAGVYFPALTSLLSQKVRESERAFTYSTVGAGSQFG